MPHHRVSVVPPPPMYARHSCHHMPHHMHQEDDMLRQAVEEHGAKNGRQISKSLPERTELQCLHRWQKVLKPTLIKGPWTAEEDQKVMQLVRQYGAKKWSPISSNLPGMIGKQFRERWHNHLNPGICKKYAIKSHWNYSMKRRVEKYLWHGNKTVTLIVFEYCKMQGLI